MTRIVFDPASLVAACLSPSSAAENALSLALRHGVVCACDASLSQLHSCLGNSRFDRYMSRLARASFFEMLQRHVWICQVSASDLAPVRSFHRSRRSRIVLALARVAEADAVVAIDPDLLLRKVWRSIPIVTTTDFVGLFDARPPRVLSRPASLQFP